MVNSKVKTTAIGNVRFSNENTYKSVASLCVCVYMHTYVCMWHMYKCIYVHEHTCAYGMYVYVFCMRTSMHTCACTRRGQRVSIVFSYYFLPYYFETEFLTEPEAP